MTRYFKDKLNSEKNAPEHIPDTETRYMYVDDHCYMAVKDPSQEFLKYNLEEIFEGFLEGKIDEATKVLFPIKEYTEEIKYELDPKETKGSLK